MKDIQVVEPEIPAGQSLEETIKALFPPGTHPFDTEIVIHQDGSADAAIYVNPTQAVNLHFEKSSPEQIEAAIVEECKKFLSREN